MGDNASTSYSSWDQINLSNVDQLEEAFSSVSYLIMPLKICYG